MTPKRLKQLAANSQHIPGIYNYCDRWCERCPATARCLTYAMELDALEEKFDADPATVGDRDRDNAKFWDGFAGNMSLVRQMIEEDCRERGLDFEAICREAKSADMKRRERVHRRRTEQDPLVKAGDQYMKAVDTWFKGHAVEATPPRGMRSCATRSRDPVVLHVHRGEAGAGGRSRV